MPETAGFCSQDICIIIIIYIYIMHICMIEEPTPGTSAIVTFLGW